jgi:hypothetical protein
LCEVGDLGVSGSNHDDEMLRASWKKIPSQGPSSQTIGLVNA